MECIFQEDSGQIPELVGLEISEARSDTLVYDDTQDDEIGILWLRSGEDPYWYRIFIDAMYTNVQIWDGENPFDEKDATKSIEEAKATEDFEELIRAYNDEQKVIKDISDLFEGRTIKTAQVSYFESGDIRMDLNMQFQDGGTVTIKRLDDDRTLLHTAA